MNVVFIAGVYIACTMRILIITFDHPSRILINGVLPMKLLQSLTFVVGLLTTCLSTATIIPAGGLGVNSNFIDNGLVTTEYRADGTVWEWLDLTVTNGISYNSLVADLNDNGLLDGSSALNANSGAVADVLALTAPHRSGWGTVSDVSVVNMFNSYFGTSLIDDTNLFAPTAPLDDSTVVERFISLFGDTYHEGLSDINATVGLNGSGKNSGYTYGMTSTSIATNNNETAYVLDGEYWQDSTDMSNDMIITTNILITNEIRYWAATWMQREITPVPEPTTLAIFGLGLIGLVARRQVKE